MAGELLNSLESVAAGQYMTIQSTTGQEWIIKNINFGNITAEIYQTDGTNNILVDTVVGTSTGGSYKCDFRCTNTKYYRVKNTSGGAVYIGYDGVRSL